MKTMKVIGSRPKDHLFPVVSWLIRLFEWSSISHVGVHFTEENVVFNTHFNETKMEKMDDYKEKHSIICEVSIPLTNKEYRELKEVADLKVDKQKGYWATLIGVIPCHIMRMFGLYIDHPFPKGYTCSWTLHELLSEFGFKFDERLDPPNCTTGDVIDGSINALSLVPKSRMKHLE